MCIVAGSEKAFGSTEQAWVMLPPGGRDGRGVVGPARDRRACVPETGYLVSLITPPAHEANLMAPGEEGVSGGIVRVPLERVLQKSRSDPGFCRHRRRRMRQSAQIEVVGAEVFGTLSPGAFNLRLLQAWLDHPDHLFGDLILQVKNVLQFSVVSVGPKMRSRFGFEQLG